MKIEKLFRVEAPTTLDGLEMALNECKRPSFLIRMRLGGFPNVAIIREDEGLRSHAAEMSLRGCLSTPLLTSVGRSVACLSEARAQEAGRNVHCIYIYISTTM